MYAEKQMIQKIYLIVLTLFTVQSNIAHANLDLPLEGIDGRQHKVSEYLNQGKWVVLNILGTRCPPCREEMPELVHFHDEQNGAMVVAIAIDFPSYGYAKQGEVASFADDYLIDFPVLLSDSNITEKLGLGTLEGLPTTYIFSPEGKVAGMQVGGINQSILENFIKKSKLQVPGSENQ